MWGIQQLRRWMRRVPIRWRLTIASLGLLTLLLSLLGVVILFVAEQTLDMNEADALWNEVRLVTRNTNEHSHPFSLTVLRSADLPPGPLSPDLLITAEALARKLPSPSTAILSPEGSVVASGNLFPYAPPPITLSPTRVQKIVASAQGGGTSYLPVSDAQGNRQIVILLPLVNADHIVALLQISTIDQTGGFINSLRFILVLGVIGALSIATALTIPLVSAALHPLVDMERTSRLIADGDLSLRLATTLTNDEIGRLSHSFNQMVAQLERSFQRQKRFVADASHELRTPLTALSGSLEMLLLGADSGDKEASRRLVGGMYSEVERMHRLVEDLLVLTRLDEGQIKLREDIVDVREVIDKVYHQAQQLAHGQIIERQFDLNIPFVRTDVDRLQQVLLNIVENALKFTPMDGNVIIRTFYKKEEKSVVIEIQDNGKGISPEDLPRIFDRFYRADPSRSRLTKRVSGSGLGLAIAKELIEVQGGKITISSQLGVGTTLTIFLRTIVLT